MRQYIRMEILAQTVQSANGTITGEGNVIVGNDILAIGTTDKDIFVKTGDGITDYTGSVTIGGTGSTVMVPKLDIGRGNVVKVRSGTLP